MPHKISEEQTRKEMIDPQLEQAGWYLRDHLSYQHEAIRRMAVICFFKIPIALKS